MCRLMAYLGSPVLLADIVTRPNHSIITQSYMATERLSTSALGSLHIANGNLNGDGFGLGWYSSVKSCAMDPTPCVFTSIKPAWNSENLRRLADKISASVVFAHVRAAFPGIPVTEQNCHPFQAGRYMFMHNGGIGGFFKIRRHLISTLRDDVYNTLGSFHSDSAVSFALFLNELEDPMQMLTPEELRCKIESVIQLINRTQAEHKAGGVSLLNFVVSDGSTVIATRYVGTEGEPAASLYFGEGTSFEKPAAAAQGDYVLMQKDRRSKVAMVASEPITASKTDWVEVPRNSMVILLREKGDVVSTMISPISGWGDKLLPRQVEVSRCLDVICSGRTLGTRSVSHQSIEGGGGGLSAPSTPTPRGSSSFSLNLQQPGKPNVRPEHVLTGHTQPVLALAMARDRLFSSSYDATVRVWDMNELCCIRVLDCFERSVFALRAYHDKLYASAGRTIKAFCIETLTCLQSFHMVEENGDIMAMALSPGLLYIGSRNSDLKSICTPSDVGCTAAAVRTAGLVQGPEAQGSHGEVISQWNAATEEDSSHCAKVYDIALVKGYLCSAGADGVVRVWRPEGLKPVTVLMGHKGGVLTLLALGNSLLSGARDNSIRVWDMEALVCRHTLPGHKDDVLALSVPGDPLLPPGGGADGPTPPVFCSLSSDGSIKLWSTGNWACVRTVRLPGSASAKPASFACTSTYAVVGSSDGALRMWPIDDGAGLIGIDGGDGSDDDMGGVGGVLTPFAHRSEGGMWGRKRSSGGAAATAGMTLGQLTEREMERTLREFVRIRTISRDDGMREECFRGAKYLAKLLEGIGAEVKLAMPLEGKNPVVIGRLGRDPRKPTVTMYGHYDVQPALETEWKSDPFDLTSMDGYLYARGVSDNKGPILAMVYAVKELVEDSKNQEMPVNVCFVFEGEEENGSGGFMEAVQGNMHFLEGTEVVLVSNTLWIGEQKPCLTYGMRGMISMSVRVSGPDKDVHSGNDGGVFNEPMSDLVKVMSSLVDSHCNILVPGFYRDVASTEQCCDGTVHAFATEGDIDSEFSVDGYRRACGVPGLAHNREADVLRARWCRPSLSLVDVITGGDGIDAATSATLGPTRFSVIPRNAVGKVSVRFVPNQAADKLVALFRTHAEHEFGKLQSPNTLDVHVHNTGDYWMGNPSNRYFKAAERAIKGVWGCDPLYVREGGTMPVTTCLESLLGAPAVHLPMGQSSDAPHLANERLKRVNFMKGRNVIMQTLHEIAKLGARPVEGS